MQTRVLLGATSACAFAAALIFRFPFAFELLLCAACAVYVCVTVLARVLALYPPKSRGYIQESARLDNAESMAVVVALTLQILLTDPVLRQALQKHSRYQKQAWVRILRTMTAFELVARGTAKDRRLVAEWIKHIHGDIGGKPHKWATRVGFSCPSSRKYCGERQFSIGSRIYVSLTVWR